MGRTQKRHYPTPKNTSRCRKPSPKRSIPLLSPTSHDFSSTSLSPPSSPTTSTPPLSSMPTSPSDTWSPWAKYVYKPLDMTNIPGSPHKIPKDFKEWLPIFSEEDLITTEDHLNAFLHALEPYDQHEDVWMWLFSYTLLKKAKEWYDSILPGTITNWDLFQERFTKIFGNNKYY